MYDVLPRKKYNFVGWTREKPGAALPWWEDSHGDWIQQVLYEKWRKTCKDRAIMPECAGHCYYCFIVIKNSATVIQISGGRHTLLLVRGQRGSDATLWGEAICLRIRAKSWATHVIRRQFRRTQRAFYWESDTGHETLGEREIVVKNSPNYLQQRQFGLTPGGPSSENSANKPPSWTASPSPSGHG